jgi:hypothetical protein
MPRSLDVKGSWEECRYVSSWYLRRYWRDCHYLVWAYRRGCREDAAAVRNDFRQWWAPVENRLLMFAALAVATLVGVLISLL